MLENTILVRAIPKSFHSPKSSNITVSKEYPTPSVSIAIASLRKRANLSNQGFLFVFN